MYEAFSILKRDYVFFLVIIFIGWNFVDVLIFVDLMVNVFFHNKVVPNYKFIAI